MKLKQIATMLNEVYGEITGESALVKEDLSNIVDVGRQITNSTLWQDNFDNYVGKMIDKVGRTIFVDRVYKSSAPDILKDSWEYASILEKVRCDVPDYSENKEWELLNPTTSFDVFKFNPPTVTAKYFNKKATYQTMISITKKQMESSFNSATDMVRFVAMIENRIAMKMSLATDTLVIRTIDNLIAEKIKAKKNVVNLLTEYNTAASTTLTAEKALQDKEFLRYAAKTIMTYKKFLAVPSMLYNNDGYVTFTPDDRLKAVFITDFAKSLETTLYADTFHSEFVELDGYSEVPYWQGSGTTNSLSDRMSIEILPASANGVAGDSDANVIKQGGIVAVMFDEWAAMVCNEDPDVRSIFNPEGNFYNYWHSFDASYYNDLGENVVVFTIADAT